MVHLFIVQATECAPLIYPTYCMPTSLWTATAQLNKLIQTSELKFDLRYLNISYTKHVNNESVGRKTKVAIGKHAGTPDYGKGMKTI